MILQIQWEKSTRAPVDKTRVSLTFKNAILDYFNGNAKRAYEYYCSNPKKPFQDWPHAYHNAFRQTRPLLSAWERGHSTFFPTFH